MTVGEIKKREAKKTKETKETKENKQDCFTNFSENHGFHALSTGVPFFRDLSFWQSPGLRRAKGISNEDLHHAPRECALSLHFPLRQLFPKVFYNY